MLSDNTFQPSSEALTTLDRIKFVIDTIEKETKQETKLVKTIFYTGVSTYTNDPINLMINSRKPGQGKSHPILGVLSYFPENDKIILMASSDRALFHDKGVLSEKDEDTGKWIPIESKLQELSERESQAKSNCKNGTLDIDERDRIFDEVRLERNDLLSRASKVISLEHKIIVFLDTPNTTLLEALMPLLSHDTYESKYKFTDKKASGKLEGTDNILWGWPAVIFAQTLDITHRKRFPELARRFIIVNPTVSLEKSKASGELAIDNCSLPDLVYQFEVVTDKEKTKAKSVVRDMKEEFLEFTKNLRNANGQYDKNKSIVLCPYHFALKDALPIRDMNDVTNVKRFMRFQNLSTIINVDRRPTIRATLFDNQDTTAAVLDLKANVEIPIVTFADTEKAIELMQDAANTGLRPEITSWYHKVFLPTFDAKTAPDEKERNGKMIQEDRKALTTGELSKATFEISKEVVESKRIRDDYLEPLYNNGLIEKSDSKIDARQNTYFPISELFTESTEPTTDDNPDIKQQKLINKKLHRTAVGRNFLEDEHLYIENITNMPTKERIKSRIEGVLKIYAEKRYTVSLFDGRHSDTEIDIESLVRNYFNDSERERCFELRDEKEVQVPSSNSYITSDTDTGTEAASSNSVSIEGSGPSIHPSIQPVPALNFESGQNMDESQDDKQYNEEIIISNSKNYNKIHQDSFRPNFLSNVNGREKDSIFWEIYDSLEEDNPIVRQSEFRQALISSGDFFAGDATQIIKDKLAAGELQNPEYDKLCRKH